ncbi:MAG TPA: hypothetical protein VJY35_02955 [Candidatus Eisenbacteria bacterium]|nr:hypothetical protein [Candidatus Eisenbacteria bacterium]
MRYVPWLAALAAFCLAAPALAVDFDDLRRGTRVRLRTGATDSVGVVGTVDRLETASGERLSQGVLHVNVDGSERAFPLLALESLEISRRRTGRGALVGALVGGGLGVLLGAGSDPGLISQGGQIVIGGLFLGLAGIPVGALMGSQMRTWESVPLERPTGWRPDLAAGPVVRLTVRW